MKRWMMKADVSAIDGLVFEDADIPEPGAGEVRVKVHAVSLNARDIMVIEYGFMRLPDIDLTPASDMSGVVDAVGVGVTDWAVGDHVVNLHFKGWDDGVMPADAGGGLGSLAEQGVLAEYIVLDASRIARAPKGYDHAEASCLPCAALTAWNAMMDDHPVDEADTVLVIGTGGVATSAMMIAKGAGASVAAVVRHGDNSDRLRDMGVDTIINSSETPEWGAAILEATGGVAKVVNTIGFSAVNQSLVACAYGGEVATMGLRDQEGPSLDFSLFGKSIRGIAVGSGAMYRALRDQVEASGEKPLVDRRFAFDRADNALNALKELGGFGKIVIEIA